MSSVVAENTESFVEASLAALDAEIERISPGLKEAWLMAQKQCADPSLVGPDHKLLFLRCEQFDVEMAALRLVHYWSKRLELFGSDKAFLPLTLHEALRDDAVTIGFGPFHFTGYKPETGEGIFFEDMSQFPKKYLTRHHKYVRRLSLVRSLWYAVHAILEEEPQCQERGLVGVMEASAMKLRHYDSVQARMFVDSLRFCLPVRFTGFHVVNPTFFVRMFFLPLVVARSFVALPIYLHGGKKAAQALERDHGLPASVIPTSIPGGKLKLDYDAWLERRRRLGL